MSELCEHETFRDICAACHRDGVINRLTARVAELEGALGDLLAIIHRDGGHYTATVGEKQSVADAHLVWADLMTRAALSPAQPAPERGGE